MEILNCFIACAFGKDDVDDIYEKGILKVLKKLDIKPLRVDKVDFLGKIDTKIIELIRKSDFCIADLTYARPSVYFESGFAEGIGKKVIYTANATHFHAKHDDEYGNFKIHFDLLTQNIIGWQSSSDNFKYQLTRKINKVIKPILDDHKRYEEETEDQKIFKSLSVTKRIKLIDDIMFRFIVKNKFILAKNEFNLFEKDNKYLQLITKSKFTKSFLESISPFDEKFGHLFFDNFIFNHKLDHDSVITIIYVCFNKASSSIIESVLPHFDKHPEKKEYTFEGYKKVKKIRYIFLDDIKSEADFKRRLTTLRLFNLY